MLLEVEYRSLQPAERLPVAEVLVGSSLECRPLATPSRALELVSLTGVPDTPRGGALCGVLSMELQSLELLEL